MLKVRVKSNDMTGAILEGEVDPRLQRCTLSKVNWVPQNMGAGNMGPNGR
jgi:hypothetical protein